MKIRTGFVSNSSSSSFVITEFKEFFKQDLRYLANRERLVIPHELHSPVTEFDWQWAIYNRFEEKVCFAVLQANYLNEVNCDQSVHDNNRRPRGLYFNMLNNVIKKYLNIKEIDYQLSINSESSAIQKGYIDHESAYPNNISMFYDEQTLHYFLFNMASYISNGNDNEEKTLTVKRPNEKLLSTQVKTFEPRIKETLSAPPIIDNLLLEEIVRLSRIHNKLSYEEIFEQAKNNTMSDRLKAEVSRMTREELENLVFKKLEKDENCNP